jgi:hypothetical protein
LAQFLAQSAAGIADIDMFVVVSASFRLLYVMIIPGSTGIQAVPSLSGRGFRNRLDAAIFAF